MYDGGIASVNFYETTVSGIPAVAAVRTSNAAL
jgi:hypothetical protein